MPSTATPTIKISCAKSPISPKAALNFILFLVAFAILYHDTLAQLFRSWFSPQGSHGPLILAVSVYLVWQKKADLKHLPKEPAILPGAILAGFGCLMLFAGKLSTTLLLQQVSVVPLLLGSIALFWGLAHLKMLIVPVCYLIFLTGFIEETLVSVRLHLQIVSAWIAAQFLILIGMPVFLTDTLIHLPHINLEVAAGCSGVSHIVALLALAVPLAMVSQKTVFKKGILILAALLIGIVANGLRIALIGVYTRYFTDAPLHGPRETLYVSFIFFFGMIVLVLLSQVLRKVGSAAPAAAPHNAISTLADCQAKPSSQQCDNGNSSPRQRPRAFITAGILFLSTLSLIHLYKPLPVNLRSPLQNFPADLAGFSGQPLGTISEFRRPFPADEEVMLAYPDRTGKKTELYIGYLASQTRERKIIDYRRDWMHEDAQTLPLHVGKDVYEINQKHIAWADGAPHIYFWYYMHGKIITDRYSGKLNTFLAALTKRKSNAAVIIVYTEHAQDTIMPFLAALLPTIHSYLDETK